MLSLTSRPTRELDTLSERRERERANGRKKQEDRRVFARTAIVDASALLQYRKTRNVTEHAVFWVDAADASLPRRRTREREAQTFSSRMKTTYASVAADTELSTRNCMLRKWFSLSVRVCQRGTKRGRRNARSAHLLHLCDVFPPSVVISHRQNKFGQIVFGRECGCGGNAHARL